LLGALPYSGSVVENNKEIFKERTRKIAYISQTPSIPHGMKVLEYISLPLTLKGTKDSEKVVEVLNQTSLYGLHNSPLAALSGGELQRALIARALIQDADTYLLDEPTSALDLHHQVAMMNVLESLLDQGKTIISTMHDISLASMYAENLIVMKSGKVVETGKTNFVIQSESLKLAYDQKISVHTLENGRTVVVADRNQRN
jgi:iron complex transport system ATP-binding protein